MASAGSTINTNQPQEVRLFDGLLSYLVPGLGQIRQGRTGKGLLFFVSVYALFFYGMYLGTGTVKAGELDYRVSGNVYLPDTLRASDNMRGNFDARLANPYKLPNFMVDLYNRPQFAGQFWVGVAAWPAVAQYVSDDETTVRHEIHERQAEADRLEDRHPEDAGRLRADAKRMDEELLTGQGRGNWLFGQFERAPSEQALNALNTSRGKELELGWVYTVIAGVLNIMIIYDAMVGPAYPAPKGA